ncbi:MarR family winged helix-turn-helix transcriptional regulator [Streptomyces sp. NPDC102364]|uniref:MarR family winged helix-turn-helix transcriptional regulator n=1 Tax=Streptomyces sp. NPDC102364 TaxID=3366161 RepID=UPI003830939B
MGDVERVAEVDGLTRRDDDPQSVDEETEQVTETVMAASRLLVALSARALATVDATLTLPQLRTLVVLDRCGPVKLAVLAATLGVNASTALRMVDKLEAGGLVDRKANPDNRREVVLRLTPSGTSLVRRVLDHRHKEVAGLVGTLPVGVRAGLVEGLRALTEAADDLAVGPGGALRTPDGLPSEPGF